MPASVRDYCFSLFLLMALMTLYQFTVADFLQAPEVARAPIVKRPLAADNQAIADLFPDGTWQRGLTTQLRTRDGILLFQHSQQGSGETEGASQAQKLADGKRWRLWPITMVIGRGLDGDSSAEPILIEAAEGAVIEFDAPLDVTSGVAPSIQRGMLRGEVRIRRLRPPEGNAVAPRGASIYAVSADGDRPASIDIRTANVGVDRRKIWTTEPIHMRVGEGNLVGRDLTLHLASSASGGGGGHTGVTGTLDRMELIYLRELSFPLKDNGRVELQCDGRIEYDFALDQLHLDRAVQLLHQDAADGLTDTFACDSLSLSLREPFHSGRVRQSALDWIDRIDAKGQPVTLNMPSQNLELRASEVLFDPVEGILLAEPFQAAANRPSAVYVQHGLLEAQLRQVLYRFDPQHPKALGTIEIRGDGVVAYQADQSPLRTFQWTDSLRVQPLAPVASASQDGDVGIWCEGNLLARLSDGGTVQTEAIEGVLKPVTQKSSTAVGDANGSVNARWFPERMTASHPVVINSPGLNARTNRLDLFFEQTTQPSSTAGSTETPTLRTWVRAPRPEQQASDRAPQPAIPPSIQGDHVTAKLTLDGGDLLATDLSVLGNVRVTHPMKAAEQASVGAGPNDQPAGRLAVLTGDQLRVRRGGSGDVLQLGSPQGAGARFEIGDGYFVGPQIQVRPNDNYMWIPSAGEFVVPTEFLPALQSMDADAPADTHWSRSPRCRFGGEMTFDGKLAKLTGGVELDASIVQAGQNADIRMRGDELHLQLSDPVDMQQPKTFQAATLSQIELLQTANGKVDVLVDRYTIDGLRDSRHHLQVDRLTWSPAVAGPSDPASESIPLAGNITAPGPGAYRGWFRGKEDESSTEGLGDSSGLIEDATRISGVHLVYRQGMQGDLLARSLTFQNGVRLARRFVDDFDETFDAALMDQLGPDQFTLDCDLLRLSADPAVVPGRGQFAETRRGSSMNLAWEVLASGAVQFRARTDRGLSEAQAHQCSYSVAKDLVTIRWNPGTPARFVQTDPLGKTLANIAVRNMSFRLRPFELLPSDIVGMQSGALAGRQTFGQEQ